MKKHELIKKLESDIIFWEKESHRCEKKDSGYYIGMCDGLKESLSYIKTGRSIGSISTEDMIKKGLTHKRN